MAGAVAGVLPGRRPLGRRFGPGGGRPAGRRLRLRLALEGVEPPCQGAETDRVGNPVVALQHLADPDLEAQAALHHAAGEEADFVLDQGIDGIQGSDEQSPTFASEGDDLVAPGELGGDHLDHRRRGVADRRAAAVRVPRWRPRTSSRSPSPIAPSSSRLVPRRPSSRLWSSRAFRICSWETP